MSQQNFTQCHLEKPTKSGKLIQVSFIPSEFAEVGKYLKIKDMAGVETDGWEVKSAGMTLPESQLQIYRDVHRHTRDASDA
jgi:hypothetical protein